ncbi:flagellar hook-length control protein FliK [Halanaerobium saccharolyticum]|uniref:Flagellar hook-length control protein FliK n=1 Tax=Halanaerobium saccharolyticum TaxID=43595 RepID=A0A4V3CFM7_9FIRM|nr:flagellar hook-length control protein FliK [Halanaerobium saccharolyticum]TDO94462.1 flagellar hook-length control protein FliK [Halanaerobium saccharolyticum]
MTEALLNNILQVSKNDFSPAKRKQIPGNSSRSFSETMQEINQRNQSSQKSNLENDDSVKDKSSSLSDQEFLSKLKKILSKNNKEVPAELLALLQGVSLSSQQKAMLEQLMLNLQNNNLDVSDLKSLLAKNSNDQNTVSAEETHLFNQDGKSENPESMTLNPGRLEKLASLLETGDQKLTGVENSKLKAELDQLAKMLINSNSGKFKNPEAKLQQILGTENLPKKLTELASLFKKSDLSLEDLTAVSEQKDLKLPLLSQALASENLNFSELGETFNLEDKSSILAELSAQLKEMLAAEKNKVSNQKTAVNVEFSDTNIFTLNSDSTLNFSSGGELESKNQNNFFDLKNSNFVFDFDPENQSLANNLNSGNISLNNTANLAENANLRSQVVEQFRGQYSPETKEMQIQLKPESLGKIDISLAYDNQKLTGKMLVESELVRAQLENSLKGLKSDLLKQGINIEQFKIEVAKKAPQQVSKQDEFAFDDQDAAFSDGETGQNQEYEQRQFFQGQYYVQRNTGNSNLDSENIIMRQQEIINRAAFSNENLNLLA